VVQPLAVLRVLLGHALAGERLDDCDRQRLGGTVAGLQGLGEVIAGLQEQDLDPGDNLREEMR